MRAWLQKIKTSFFPLFTDLNLTAIHLIY